MACAFADGQVLYAKGGYDFHALRSTEGARWASMIAFDLLSLDGKDLRGNSVEEHRRSLQALLLERGRPALTFSAETHGEGREIFQHDEHLCVSLVA